MPYHLGAASALPYRALNASGALWKEGAPGLLNVAVFHRPAAASQRCDICIKILTKFFLISGAVVGCIDTANL